MTRKTGRKWMTDSCGRCGEAHRGYSGKLDAGGVEYVVCGVTHKRMNVTPREARDAMFATAWVEDDGGDDP